MRRSTGSSVATLGIMLALTLALARPTGADAVTDANARASVIASKLAPTPVAVRAMAIVQVSVYEAVNAIVGGKPVLGAPLDAAPGASLDAAVAAATRAALTALAPAEKTAIEADYGSALLAVPDGDAKTRGMAVGERAAAAVLAMRADDGNASAGDYRPATTPGVYVPTALPAVPQWGARKPWVLSSGRQFRPAPPPDLKSERWARDVNEVRTLGGRNSTLRTAEQTAIARFWEATSPTLYWPLVRCVAVMPGRDAAGNARLLAAAAVAMDDAAIAVFDAKYAYGFWRPITAIRNGDLDGNDATPRDASWLPFIETPMHPEYPCAHCIISGSLGAVIDAELGGAPAPVLSTTSPTAAGAVRSWRSVRELVEEVSSARIYDGVHYRNSTEVGAAMGRSVGELAAKRFAARGR